MHVSGEILERFRIGGMVDQLLELRSSAPTTLRGPRALVERVGGLDPVEPFRLLLPVHDEVDLGVAAGHLRERLVADGKSAFRLGDQRAFEAVELIRAAFEERDRDDVRPAASVGGESAGEVDGLADVAVPALELEGVDPAELPVESEVDARGHALRDLPAQLVSRHCHEWVLPSERPRLHGWLDHGIAVRWTRWLPVDAPARGKRRGGPGSAP